MKKVFLGGTCNDSTWRDNLIPMLNIDYFNPVVDDWTPAAQWEELRQRELCDFCLYAITPLMAGFYSIAEVVDDSNKRPDKTILCLLGYDGSYSWSPKEQKSFNAIANMVTHNGGTVLYSLEDVAHYLNQFSKGTK